MKKLPLKADGSVDEALLTEAQKTAVAKMGNLERQEFLSQKYEHTGDHYGDKCLFRLGDYGDIVVDHLGEFNIDQQDHGYNGNLMCRVPEMPKSALHWHKNSAMIIKALNFYVRNKKAVNYIIEKHGGIIPTKPSEPPDDFLDITICD